MREIDIINYLLDSNPKLKASYELYHSIQYRIKHRQMNWLKRTLNENSTNVLHYMKVAIKTAKKYMNYIENTLKYNYTNGILEGINNKIKVIKRIAFGFKCFYYFKNRILISQNLLEIKMA